MEKKSKKVSVDFSLTLNLGNFNSAKLGGTLEDYCTDAGEYEDVFDELFLKIKEKVYKELNNINKEFRNRK